LSVWRAWPHIFCYSTSCKWRNRQATAAD
jgi:hypothetical protein